MSKLKKKGRMRLTRSRVTLCHGKIIDHSMFVFDAIERLAPPGAAVTRGAWRKAQSVAWSETLEACGGDYEKAVLHFAAGTIMGFVNTVDALGGLLHEQNSTSTCTDPTS